MSKTFLRSSSYLTAGLVVFSLSLAKPAAAFDLDDIAKGAAAAVVINELIKNQNNQSQSQGATGSTQSASGSGQSASSAGSGQSVAQTQRALTELGYDPGPIDGQMGGKTRAAIEAFQASRGYPVTGKLSKTEFAALNSAYSTLVEAPGPGQLTKASTYEAQLYLSDLGYNVGAPDGVWGPKSQAALDAYRASSGTQKFGPLSVDDISAMHLKVHNTPAPDNLASGVPASGNLALGGNAGLGASGSGSGSGSGLNLSGQQTLGNNGSQQAAAGMSGLSLGAVQPPTGLGAGGLGTTTGQPELDLGGQQQLALNAQTGGEQTQSGQAQAGFGIGDQTNGEVAQTGTATGTASSAQQPAPVDPSAYVHLSDKPVEGMENVERKMAVQIAKARPQLLDDPSNVRRWFDQDHPRSGQSALRQAYDSGNEIEKEDVLRQFSDTLRAEIAQAPAITSGNPQPIALYQIVNLGSYVDGEGLQLQGQDVTSFRWQYRTRYLSAFATMRADLPGTDMLRISRDEAAQAIDYVKASKKRLFRVVWGQVSTVGEDQMVADFAKSTGQYGANDVATTFSVDRVTLNLADGAYQKQPKIQPAIYTFELQRGSTRGAGTPVMAFLQERGVPVMNGHLLLGNGQYGQQVMREIVPNGSTDPRSALDELSYLTWLKLNPDFAGKGMNFVSVAARVMTDPEKRQFFGDGAQHMHFSAKSAYHDVGSTQNVFADEFAAQDAKQAFLSSYYPRILGTLPEWPVPVIQVIGARLGQYDFENQFFPIQYDAAGSGQSLNPRVVHMAGTHHRSPLVSADRLAALPTRLDVPVDQARALRDAMGGGNRVYLGWTATFDMDEDGTEHELKFDPSNEYVARTGMRPGRASLNQIALFRDPALTQVVQQYDPEEMIQNPEFDAAPALGDGPEAILANMTLAEPVQLLKSAVNLIEDFDVKQAVIMTHQAVRQADEFSVDDKIAEAEAYWETVPTGDVWFQGQAQLGRYDRETEMFPFDVQASQNNRLVMGRETPFNARATPELTDPDLFEALPVPEAVAREIVQGDMRSIQFYVRVRPLAASRVSNQDNRFNLMMQPVEIIYVQPNLASGAVLAHRKFETDENFFSETFAASDFPELKERLPLDLGTIQLLRVRQMSDADLEANIENLMAETFYYESQRDSFLPVRFFENIRYFTPEKMTLYRDRYQAWIRARAEALGTRFSVTHDNGVQASGCRYPGLLRAEYDVPGQWGLDTTAMVANGQRVIEASRVPGETALMPDHLYFLGAIEGAARQTCNQQAIMGTLSLDGVGLVLAEAENQPHYYQTRQIDFELQSVDMTQGKNDIPIMQLKGVATETRYYNAHRNNLAGITPTHTIANSQALANLATDTALETKASLTTSSDADEPESNWPVVENIPFTGLGRDTVGIQLGMSMEEAEAIIKAEFDVSIGFETSEPDGTSDPAFAFVRTYFLGGANQSISLMSYSPDGPILAVSRHLLKADGPWPQEAITTSLIDKYSVPAVRTADDSMLIWSSSQSCVNLPLVPLGDREWQKLGATQDEGGFDAALAASVRASVATMSDGLKSFMDESESCGETLIYSRDPLMPIDGQYGFFTFMTDLSAAHAVTKTLTVAPEKEVEIKF